MTEIITTMRTTEIHIPMALKFVIFATMQSCGYCNEDSMFAMRSGGNQTEDIAYHCPKCHSPWQSWWASHLLIHTKCKACQINIAIGHWQPELCISCSGDDLPTLSDIIENLQEQADIEAATQDARAYK